MTRFRIVLLTPLRAALALAAIVAAPLVSSADPVNVVNPATLTTPYVVDFEGAVIGPVFGTNYDGNLVSDGIPFAERFAGQTLSLVSDFDVLSGTPSGPLQLQNGLPDQNVAALVDNNQNVMAGLGPQGFSTFALGIGEGSFAVLFPVNQSQLAIDFVGTALGSATFDFFRRDGSLIQRVVVSNLTDGAYGFLREGNVADIAGYSVINNDGNGIAYDNLRYNAVPEPSSFALLGISAAGLIAACRRRRLKS